MRTSASSSKVSWKETAAAATSFRRSQCPAPEGAYSNTFESMHHATRLFAIVLLTIAGLTSSAQAQVPPLTSGTFEITLEDGKDLKKGYTFTVDIEATPNGGTSKSFYQKDGEEKRTEQPNQAATFQLHWTGLFYSWASKQGGGGFTWWSQDRDCWIHEVHRPNGKVLIRELHAT